MAGARQSGDLILQYARSHQHPVNRFCHTVGIPLIVLSLVVAVAGVFVHGWLWTALVLFVTGWVFQFVGHAFEGKPPEFLSNWRFLFVGVRWWLAKVRGKA